MYSGQYSTRPPNCCWICADPSPAAEIHVQPQRMYPNMTGTLVSSKPLENSKVQSFGIPWLGIV